MEQMEGLEPRNILRNQQAASSSPAGGSMKTKKFLQNDTSNGWYSQASQVARFVRCHPFCTSWMRTSRDFWAGLVATYKVLTTLPLVECAQVRQLERKKK